MCMCFGWMHIRNPWKKRYEKVLKMFVCFFKDLWKTLTFPV